MAEQLRMLEMNKVLLTGRLTRDPELRFTPSNQAVTTISVASSRRYKDTQSGEWKEITSFVQVVAWGKQAENIGQYLKKGSAVAVEGRLQSRSYETKTGEKRSVLEVVADRVQFLNKAGDSAGSDSVVSDQSAEIPKIDDEEDIPF